MAEELAYRSISGSLNFEAADQKFGATFQRKLGVFLLAIISLFEGAFPVLFLIDSRKIKVSEKTIEGL